MIKHSRQKHYNCRVYDLILRVWTWINSVCNYSSLFFLYFVWLLFLSEPLNCVLESASFHHRRNRQQCTTSPGTMPIIFKVAGTVIIPVPTMVVEILNTAPENDALPKFCSSKDLSWCSSGVGQPLQPHSGSQAVSYSSSSFFFFFFFSCPHFVV